jgi:hypothetical protein
MIVSPLSSSPPLSSVSRKFLRFEQDHKNTLLRQWMAKIRLFRLALREHGDENDENDHNENSPIFAFMPRWVFAAAAATPDFVKRTGHSLRSSPYDAMMRDGR